MKIINVGVYPPPYGGVSNHLKRLLDYLQSQEKDCLLIDISLQEKQRQGVINLRWAKAIVFLWQTPRSIVHFHNFSLRDTFFYFILSLKHITVLSFHNERFIDELNSRGNFIRNLACYFLNTLDCIVLDRVDCQKLAESIIWDKTKTTVIPEFIPPKNYPPIPYKIILEARQKHTYLISSNAFRISFHKGQDTYGIDLLVSVMNRLVNENNLDVAMCFLLPDIGDIDYFNKINLQIKQYNLEERFHFITEPVEESSSVWQISDLVIRATNTDGNSLTVMEALYLKVPVVASDCVERPEGTILFKTRDADDLFKKVLQVLLDLNFYRERLNEINIIDNAPSFLKLYESLEMVGSR